MKIIKIYLLIISILGAIAIGFFITGMITKNISYTAIGWFFLILECIFVFLQFKELQKYK